MAARWDAMNSTAEGVALTGLKVQIAGVGRSFLEIASRKELLAP